MASILRALVAEYLARGHASAYEINDGSCEDFANDAARRLPGAHVCQTPDWTTIPDDQQDAEPPSDDTHVFLRIGRRYYDAEAPDGVTVFWHLPLFRNNYWNAVADGRTHR